MKTIQQILNELDSKAIEKAYFYEHPVKLYEVENHDDMTIGEFRTYLSKKFQDFLLRLRKMEIIDNPKEQGILFAYKSLNDWNNSDVSVDLIYAEELLVEEDVSKVTSYAYEYMEQKEVLSFLVADTKFTNDNLMDIVVDFLFEISFFGYNQEYLKKAADELNEAIKECEEQPESLIRHDFEEFNKELGLQEKEVYPEEDERRQKYIETGNEYARYCRNIELFRIKENYKTGKYC